jgi:hypothetical protein
MHRVISYDNLLIAAVAGMLTLHDHRTGYTGVVYFLDGQRCFEETINKNDELRHAQSLPNLCWIHRDTAARAHSMIFWLSFCAENNIAAINRGSVHSLTIMRSPKITLGLYEHRAKPPVPIPKR